jgi:sugar-specific transcriptional regulator TrmB
MTDQDIRTLLAQFDLSPIEIDIYLYLIGKEPQTIVGIAKTLHLPRTTIYDNTGKLLEKGLIEREIRYKSQAFRAHPVNILQGVIDQKNAEAANLQTTLKQIQAQLVVPELTKYSTKVRYYHGRQGLQQMMYNSLNAEKETFGYSVYGRVEIVGKKFTKTWVEDFKAKNLRDRVITNDNPRTLDILKVDVKPYKHQQTLDQDIRYLPQRDFYVSGDTTIYNHIFAVCYWLEGEVVGIEIDNPELVKTQKSIFELLWKQAHPISGIIDPPRKNPD